MIVQLLVLGMCAMVLGSGWVVLLAQYIAKRPARDPRVILRRSKKKLKTLRKELDRVPATREVHNLYGEIEDTERTIERTESWFHHAAGK